MWKEGMGELREGTVCVDVCVQVLYFSLNVMTVDGRPIVGMRACLSRVCVSEYDLHVVVCVCACVRVCMWGGVLVLSMYSAVSLTLVREQRYINII